MFKTASAAARLAALLLLLTACSKNADPGSETPPETTDETLVRFTLHTENLSAGEEFGTVTAYLFDAAGSLYKTETLVPDTSRSVELTTRTDTEAYFLAGTTLEAAAGMSRSEFLQLSVGADRTHADSAPEFLAGQASFAAGAPASVSFRRRTARIDLDTSADASIAVTGITLTPVPAATYPFVEHRAATDRTLTYAQHYAQPLAGRATDLFRVYETAEPVEVFIEATCEGIPVQIAAAFPALSANHIYTLVLRNAGAQLESSFVVAPWEEGDTVVGTPDTDARILLDAEYSHFPEGVQVDFAANSVAVPAAGAAVQLAFRASMPIEIAATEGLTEEVRISEAEMLQPEPGCYVSRYTVTVAPQGRGRLGYEVLLHLKYALYKGHYDYVSLRIAPSDYQIETVRLAGSEWMAFNARTPELEDQVYPLDGCSVEQMYRTNWLACVGGLFQFGRRYMYVPWQGYNPANDLGGQQQDVPWRNESHMPCPEGYRVPTPAEWKALLPDGTVIPGRYYTADGERIDASLLTAETPVTTPTGVTGTPRYVKLETGDGRCLILPLAGSKGDKSTTNNPGFGQRAIIWTDDNTGMPGGWALTHAVTFANEAATAQSNRLQMEGFASVRCVKK